MDNFELGQSGFCVLAKSLCLEPVPVAFLSRLRAYVHRQISPIHTITGLCAAAVAEFTYSGIFGC